MKLEQKQDGWWITNTPAGVDNMGPYETKADANDDMQGVKRFLAEEEKQEKRRKKGG